MKRYLDLKALLCMLMLLTLTACGGGGGNSGGSSAPPPEVPNQSAVAKVAVEKQTTITVDDPKSPIFGTRIVIPKEASIDPVTVAVGYEDKLPAPLNKQALKYGGKLVSKVIIPHVNKPGRANFEDLVEITIPYDKRLAGDISPIVVYWDETHKMYRPVAVTKVDKEKGTITFVTSHFSRFMAIIVNLLGIDMPAVDTKFRVGTDSILHINFGSYEFGGHCAAFASLSSHYFSLAKPKKLFDFAQDGDKGQPLDDELVRSALSYTYTLYSKKVASVHRIKGPSQKETGYQILSQMIVTQQPIILSLRGNNNQFRHAVTVFGYDADNARFRIYDSNYPNTEVTYDWELLTGFGAYSNDYGVTFDNIGYYTEDTFGAPAQYDQIIADWESGALKDYFANLTVIDPDKKNHVLKFNGNVEITVPDQKKVTLSGKFKSPAGNKNKTNYLWVIQNGKDISVSPIPASGDFSFDVDGSSASGNEIILIVSGHKLSKEVGFAAYGTFKLTGQNFFKNLGFEKGDFSDWTVFTFLRSNGSTFTPTKKYILNPGFDPIAKDIPTVIVGKHAAQLNDRDNGYHVTRVSQKAKVPNSTNPQLKFYWAAILEDPKHTPDDQPYVDVIVRDVTKATELYRRRFYTGDPKWKGWKEYSDGGSTWKAISWQTVVVTDLAKYAGDEVELSVEGADCGLGAHGGYVYLDGEE